MKTIRSIAALLALAVLFSSCQLIEIDPEYYRVKVVATVGDEEITNGEVQDVFQEQAYLFAMYGMDLSDPEQQMDMKEDILDRLVDDKAKVLKAKKEGYDQLPEEERAEVVEAATQEFEDAITEAIDTMRAQDEGEDGSASASSTKTDEEYRAEALQMYEDSGHTLDTVLENAINAKAVEKLDEAAVGDVTATEEELQQAYDEALADEQAQFDADEASYTGNYLTPEGSIRVKHILIGIPSEEQTKIDALESEATKLEALVNGEEPAEGDEYSASPSIVALSDEEKTALAETKRQEAENIRSAAIDALKADADSAYAKVQAGDDFDALIEEFGTDPGQQSGDGASFGYVFNLENNTFVEEFVAASKDLAIDAYTEPVRSKFGWHIIKRYPDTATLDMVRESLTSDIESVKSSERKDAALAEWLTEFKVSKNYKNIT